MPECHNERNHTAKYEIGRLQVRCEMEKMKYEAYLEDLENRIDQDIEAELHREWIDFTDACFAGDIFVPARKTASVSELSWPLVSVNQALSDPGAMVLQQYGVCSQLLGCGAGEIMCVRGNYGTCIIPSLFDAEIFYMEDSLNTLPTNRHIPGGLDTAKRLLDGGIPDIRRSFGGAALRMCELYAEIAGKYPKIGRFVHIYHPDTQSPMDVCELLIGSSLFTLVYDHPDVLKDLLDLVTDTIIEYLQEYLSIVPSSSAYTVHWGMMFRGFAMLRDDSAMNFSPEMYEEFIKPYDQRIFDRFGGGGIHFCGRGDHYIESMSSMPGLNAIQMSQPELNNMEKIYSSTVDKSIALIGFQKPIAQQSLQQGRSLHSRVQCFG